MQRSLFSKLFAFSSYASSRNLAIFWRKSISSTLSGSTIHVLVFCESDPLPLLSIWKPPKRKFKLKVLDYYLHEAA
jgi:hypothetical protein